MPMELTPGGTHGATVPRRFLKILNRPMMALVRLLRGRGVRIQGQPVLLLTTVGAKSGRLHTVPLLWLPDGENRWLVAASFGGNASHPAWYVNLVRHPESVWVEVNGRKRAVLVDSLTGPERETAWAYITFKAPIYAKYQMQTDREIPVIRLTAAPSNEVSTRR